MFTDIPWTIPPNLAPSLRTLGPSLQTLGPSLRIGQGKAMADERLPKDSSIQPPEQRVDRCWAELVMPPRSPSHWIPGR